MQTCEHIHTRCVRIELSLFSTAQYQITKLPGMSQVNYEASPTLNAKIWTFNLSSDILSELFPSIMPGSE